MNAEEVQIDSDLESTDYDEAERREIMSLFRMPALVYSLLRRFVMHDMMLTEES